MQINIDRSMHVISFLTVFTASLYFVFQLENAINVLSVNMENISAGVSNHIAMGSHPSAREDIKSLTTNVTKLLAVVEGHNVDVSDLKEQTTYHYRNGKH